MSQRWLRIIPVAFVMYLLAYMDRINVSVVLPYMQDDMHLSSAQAANLSGVFFFGYLIMQIPGGILASRWSARKFIFIMMIIWGLFATLCGLVQTAEQFMVMRFLLGVSEGGVMPAMIILLSSWFSSKERAKANALWLMCLPVSAVIMAPLSGVLLKYLDWHAVLVIEGLFPVAASFLWLAIIKDRPTQVKWMNERDRSDLIGQLEKERIVDASKPKQSAAAALWNPTAWMLVCMYFFFISGFYGYTMWVPSVIKSFDQGSVTTGWLTAIPFSFALIGMMINAYWSDRRMKRIAHVVIPFIIAAAALLVGQWVTDPVGKMVLLCIAAIGVYSPFGALWAVPTTVLPSAIIGVAVGLQNALGSLGGYLGPMVVGRMKDVTGDYRLGFFMLSGSLVCAAIMMLLVVRTSRGAQVQQSNAVLRNAEPNIISN